MVPGWTYATQLPKLIYRTGERAVCLGRTGVLRREHRCEWRELSEGLASELERLKHEAAFVDPATGVGNLHQLDVQFAKLLGRWRRTREPFALVLIAIADPHDPGLMLPAAAVAHLARILTETARIEDTVCRASQNEFAVLLANSTMDGARAFLERARNTIAREPIRTGHGSRFYRSAAGAAQWADSVESLPALLHLADAEVQKLHGEIMFSSQEYRPAV